MEKETVLYHSKEIKNRIFAIRGHQVMIDRDLAEMYRVETKVLNQAVKRNLERFPEQFRFQLTVDEAHELVTNCDRFGLSKPQISASSSRSQIVTLNKSGTKQGQNIKYLPFAFTEQGVAMLSAVLKSETAVRVSIQIINTFVEMRKLLLNNAGLLQRVENIETKLQLNDKNFEFIFASLANNKIAPKQDIFFNGQIFDAYHFLIQLIEKAEKSILIIDNYVDASILQMLSKKQKHVKVQIITQATTSIKPIDIDKFNQQYPDLSLQYSSNFHDRFLLIDHKTLCHIGASLKDLGKKCFAFSLIEEKQLINNLLSKL